MKQNLFETQKKYKVIENKLSESIDDLLDKENTPISKKNKKKPSLVFEEINSVVVPNFQE